MKPLLFLILVGLASCSIPHDVHQASQSFNVVAAQTVDLEKALQATLERMDKLIDLLTVVIQKFAPQPGGVTATEGGVGVVILGIIGGILTAYNNRNRNANADKHVEATKELVQQVAQAKGTGGQ